jgi:uncharacterized protein YjiS (DUF1127 family)
MLCLANNVPTKPQRSAAPSLPLGWLRGLAGVVLEWRRRMRDRRELARLSERDLRDMGLPRLEAYAEIAKPFWRD